MRSICTRGGEFLDAKVGNMPPELDFQVGKSDNLAVLLAQIQCIDSSESCSDIQFISTYCHICVSLNHSHSTVQLLSGDMLLHCWYAQKQHNAYYQVIWLTMANLARANPIKIWLVIRTHSPRVWRGSQLRRPRFWGKCNATKAPLCSPASQ